MHSVTETNCNGKLVFVIFRISTQLKIFQKIDVTRNFWLNSVYNNWLCYRLQTLAVGRMAQKMGFAPCCRTYKRQKTASKCTKNYYFGDKKWYCVWRGATALSPNSPRTPPPRRLAPPPSSPRTEECNYLLTFWKPKYATDHIQGT